MRFLGIDIGSTSVKAVLLDGLSESWHDIVAHEGAIPETLLEILRRRGVDGDLAAVVTGNAGRQQVRCAQAILPLAIESALAAIGERARAVVSLGGESLCVYMLSADGRIQNTLTGDKCAAGTGEFFRQQLRRMDLGMDCLSGIPDETRCHPLSARCSVFMKSDCTHKLNKKEATKEEIVVSLADVMASKAAEFLTRARIESGRVLLIGGVTQNRFLLRLLKQKLPQLELVVPAQAPYFEAFGAAHLATEHGEKLPPRSSLFAGGVVGFEHYPPLSEALPRVRRIEAHRGRVRPEGEYILGIDGGSTTTKAVLVDARTREICAAFYGRTHGDPVEALRQVLREIRAQVREQIGDAPIRIPLAATTGSSREVLGVFTKTRGVYNEIIAHTVGTTHFQPAIDTIFEIGGQDAKYVLVQNGVPIDYAMNEACSAGTGSFIEESARGDLNIASAPEIGPIALHSRAPLKFGEHCSAFINSDIRAAIQQGAERADITAGIIFSIVSNYLNRVVGNRTVGQSIVLQGGVAKNPAVPAAFATVLGKSITVPPEPELLGAFGVALLSQQKHAAGELSAGDYSLDELIARKIENGKTFLCQACENRCPIRTLIVSGHRTFFGGRCNKYANLRKAVEVGAVDDFVALRERLLFSEYAPDPMTLRPRCTKTVGVPRAFTVHTLWPLYSWFFHELGVRVVLSEASRKEGVQRAEAAYCLPGELAHGMTADLLQRGVDYLFVPHLKNLPSLEPDLVATLCPITQGLPYYLRPAFEIADERLLRPVLDFSGGMEAGVGAFEDLAARLGFSRAEGRAAFQVGLARQRDFWARLRQIGEEVLAQARDGDRPVIALFGRPYNAFNPEANMGVPRKFATRGYRVLPFDFFPVGDEAITYNMYWYYGQLNLKAARRVKQHPNLFLCYISNFGCAPDSFMLHFIRWFMGAKPYLVLEFDSHTADAGIDTRIEAFLDIIDGYRRQAGGARAEREPLRYTVDLCGANTRIVDRRTGERIPLADPRVTVIYPSMGNMASAACAAITRAQGIRSEALPEPDVQTTQLARNVASGKECIPTLLVLGQMLRRLMDRPPAPDEILAVVVPKTTGPCRTGQYGPFYEGILRDLGIDNVAILYLSSDNAYSELGEGFTLLAWYALVLSDFFKDMETALTILAKDRAAALEVLRSVWNGALDILGHDIDRLYPYLESQVPRLAAIPRRGRLEDLPKVLVVGEIYVRRDDYSVRELVTHLAENGILGKVTGIAEWINYCNYLRDKELRRRWARRPFYRWPLAKGLGEWLGLKVTRRISAAIEERLRGILEPSGLLPHVPHDMERIMAGVDGVTHVEFETEATISSLVSRVAIAEGYDGVAAIAPFACLPGRLIRAILEPHFRRHAVPYITLENDGLLYPPNTLSRLEIFMLNVLRRKRDGYYAVSAARPSQARAASQAVLKADLRLLDRRAALPPPGQVRDLPPPAAPA